MHFLLFFLLFVIATSLFLTSYSYAAPDESIKLVESKYKIIKYQSIYPKTDLVKIELINLNQTGINENNPREFKIIKSDLTATNMGKLSWAENSMSEKHILLYFDEQQEKPIKNNSKITIPSDSELYITTDTSEIHSVTYHGKIYLVNEKQNIPIEIEVEVVHNPMQISMLTFSGIAFVLIAYHFQKNRSDGLMGFKLEQTEHHWLFIIFTTIISLPTTLFVNTFFVGNYFLDLVISLGVGVVVIGKMIKKSSITDDSKLKITLEVDKHAQDKGRELASKLQKDYLTRGWFGMTDEETICVDKIGKNDLCPPTKK